ATVAPDDMETFYMSLAARPARLNVDLDIGCAERSESGMANYQPLRRLDRRASIAVSTLIGVAAAVAIMASPRAASAQSCEAMSGPERTECSVDIRGRDSDVRYVPKGNIEPSLSVGGRSVGALRIHINSPALLLSLLQACREWNVAARRLHQTPRSRSPKG